MKKQNWILALLLTLALCLGLLAGCAKKADETEKPQDGTPTQTPDAPDESDEQGEPEELKEIVFYYVTANTIETDAVQAVSEAVNEISEREIGVHVDLHPTALGNYVQTVTMAISGGEQVDICSVYCVAPVDFSTMYAAGQLMDIKPLLEEYGQPLLETVGDYIDAYALDGGIYGVPVLRDYAASNYFVMRTDILNELGMLEQAQNATKFSDIEAIYDAVLEGTDLYPIGGQQIVLWYRHTGLGYTQDDWSVADRYDSVGDGLYVLHTDDNGTITNVFESDAFKWTMEKTNEWYENGYIWPDTALNSEHVDTIMKQGILFSSFQMSEIGVEGAKLNSTGYEVTCLNVGNAYISTSAVVKFGCGVPVVAKEPEAAVKFLNLAYNSPEVMTLLDWGIEGRDYYINDAGEAAYPDGNAEVPYHENDYMFGNYFLVVPWEGNGSDFRERAKEDLAVAPISHFLGFMLNASELTNEVAAITAVEDEFVPALTTGSYTDELYQSFLDKLSSAGVDTYIESAQTQLNAYLAAK